MLIDAQCRGLHLVGESFALLPTFRAVARIVDCDTPVLICGERGTGKTMLARVIHSQCAHGAEPFHLVDLAADPALDRTAGIALEEALIERLSATDAERGERCRRGTIYFRHIESATPASQTRIAALLRERIGPLEAGRPAPSLRVMLSSSALGDPDFGTARLLPELQVLLDMVTITMPPLRERGEDIVLLARHFAARLAERRGERVPELSAPAIDWLRSYSWPRNIAELRSVMEGALEHAGDGVLRAEHLRLGLDTARMAARLSPGSHPPTLRDLRRAHIARALRDSGGDVDVAARMLGMRQPLLARILRHSDIGLAPLADGPQPSNGAPDLRLTGNGVTAGGTAPRPVLTDRDLGRSR